MTFLILFFPQLLELIAKSQLTSLSGIAQKNYMNILEKVVQKGKRAQLLVQGWTSYVYSLGYSLGAQNQKRDLKGQEDATWRPRGSG